MDSNQLPKTQCYFLAFYDLPTIARSLEFICQHPELDVYVIENPSIHTPQIKRLILDYIEQGKVQSYYLFDKNISNNAVHTIAKNAKILNENVIFTDGDLVADPSWLEESFRILNRHEMVGAVSTELSLHNLPTKTFPDAVHWVPSPIRITEDYIDGSGGHHLLLLRKKWVKPLLAFIEMNNLTWTDGTIRLFLSKVDSLWVKTKHARATHLTWDLYADLGHEYTKLRLSKTMQQTWEHNEWCGYKLITKDGEAYYPLAIQVPTTQF